MRILIDGMDLSGKTTLSHRLVGRMEACGLRVRHTRLTLYGGLHARLVRVAYRNLPPGSLLCAWAFAFAALVDRMLDLVAPVGTWDVHIHEAHAAHTAAYAAGFGHRRTAAVLEAARWLWPRFGHILLLTARPATRRARLAQRSDNDANDMLLVLAPLRFHRIEARLADTLTEMGATVIETDRLGVEAVESVALDSIGMRSGIGSTRKAG